jgi:hypothetical protein
MLTLLTTDFHLANLPGVEDVAVVSTMVFYGVRKASDILHIAVNK